MELQVALLVTVLVVLVLFKPGQSQCFHENQRTTIECVVPAGSGSLRWYGSVFYCPSDDSSDNHTITIITTETCPQSGQGSCGPYSADLECIDGGTNLKSTLVIDPTNRFMNGEHICCKHRGQVPVNKTLHIGVTPSPPNLLNLLQVDRETFVYQWVRPGEEVVGGIRGYNLTFSGNCGNCSGTPTQMVDHTTHSMACTATDTTPENAGEECEFEVRTVTDDCGFLSQPRNRSDILFSTLPTAVRVTVLCADGMPHDVHVEWNYVPPPGLVKMTSVLGFEVEFTDTFGNGFTPVNCCLTVQPDVRYCQFVLSLLEESTLRRDSGVFITVTVKTKDGNFSSNSTDITGSLPQTLMQCSSGCSLQQTQCINGTLNSTGAAQCNCELYAFFAILIPLVIIAVIIIMIAKLKKTQ